MSEEELKLLQLAEQKTKELILEAERRAEYHQDSGGGGSAATLEAAYS